MAFNSLTVLEWVLASTGALYLLTIAWLFLGLRRVFLDSGRHVAEDEGDRETLSHGLVSVIVAARDEEHTLPDCLRALQTQQYAGEFEVIVVDDRSGDDTAGVVRRFAEDWPALRLVRVTERTLRCPKKNALAVGIESSRGQLLLFTDADCVPAPEWVSSTAGAFEADVGMVIGYAAAKPGRRWVHKLLALDNLAVAAMGAGSTGMGAPLSCSGRNLAFRRRVYDQVGGYSSIGHLIGGDDVYMMRLIRQETDWRVAYNADPLAAVMSDPGTGAAAEVVQQKLRHASKAAHYGGPARLLGICVYVFHLSLLLGLCRAVTGDGIVVITVIWSLRWLVDGVFLWHFANRFRQNETRLLRFLPLLEVAHLPYVLIGVPLGSMGLFRWKGFRNGAISSTLEGHKVVI
jgi:glycosyltransferase involved in cell wall biosynthesis